MQASLELESKIGYKQTQLGDIPVNWKVNSLKEFAKVQGGFAFKSKNFLKNGKYQVIKMSNLYNGELDLDRSASFLNEISDSELEFLIHKGDILLTLTGTVGKRDYGHTVYINEQQNLLLNQRVGRITPLDNRSDSLFVYYLTKTHRFLDQFFFTARGGTGNQANVSTTDIEQIKVALPPLPEQHAIASVLSTWDKGIEKLQQLIAAKQKRKKALMQQLLTGKRRFKEFTDEWQEVELRDVFNRVTRKNTESNTNVLTISAQRGLINQEHYFNKQVASETLDNYYLLKNGEFAYNKSYSNGYPMGAIKRLKYYDAGVVTTLYICFRLKDTKRYSPEFMEHYFNAGFMNRGLKGIAHEGGRAHGLLNVAPTDFFNLKLSVPDYEEQQKIASVLNAADKEISSLQQKLSSLKQQKKGLMQKLLTGQVQVNLSITQVAEL